MIGRFLEAEQSDDFSITAQTACSNGKALQGGMPLENLEVDSTQMVRLVDVEFFERLRLQNG